MKIITLGVILFFSSIISAQIEKIDIPKNKMTKKYLTKVLVDYLNRNENHNVKIPFWVKPIHNNNFNKLNKNKIYSTNKDWNHLPIKNVKGVYEFCGVLINHSDFNHIMFVYNNYVKIIAEAEEKV